MVHESLKSGINYIDAAPWYGHGKAESVCGKAFKGVPRESFYFSTKVGRYEADVLEMFDFSRERTLLSVRESLDHCYVLTIALYGRTLLSVRESLDRTGLDYIDIIQVHDPEFSPNVDIIVNETLPALEECRKAGQIRFIGVTGYPLDLQREIIEKCKAKGVVHIDTSLAYCHYSLNATGLKSTGYIDFLKSQGIGLIGASPIAMGLLTSRGPPGWHPAHNAPHIIDACSKANEYCKVLYGVRDISCIIAMY